MILMMVLAQAVSAAAQQTQPAATTTNTTTTTTTAATASDVVAEKTSYDADELRSQFSSVLRRLPSDIPHVLALDPSLLSNDTYVAGYPQLAQFVAAHPEVRRNARFYLGEFQPYQRRTQTDDIIEAISVLLGLTIGALTLAWLVRTIIEQRRWNRLSRTQTEVHNKILDRFSTSAELLEYVRSSAGAKFLESAPIPVSTGRAVQAGPSGRIMSSIQLGIIVVTGAIGALLVSYRLDADAARALFAFGAIALCIGGGFIISAAVSVVVSKRLGLWQAPEVDVR
jgi:hypothetical protein